MEPLENENNLTLPGTLPARFEDEPHIIRASEHSEDGSGQFSSCS
jgi:hypothetical protein